MTAPPPDRYVTGILHGGPFDGTETDLMPWARIDIPMTVWDGDTMDACHEVKYTLAGHWNGEPTAHYRYVKPPDPSPVRTVHRRRRTARQRASQLLTSLARLIDGRN